MWNVGTVAQVCEIRACNNCPLLSFGREWYCDNSHVVTSCQSKVFFYRGNINSFLFLSKDCTPNILTENFPGRGAMPCIATLPERKVNLMIHSALKKKKTKRPPSIHPHPFTLFFHMSFPLPPKHDTESHPWGHMQLKASYDLTENWIQRTLKASFLFIICFVWDCCHKDSFYEHSPFILSLKGVEHSQGSCVGERSREFPSPFSKILRTHTHMGRSSRPWCTRGSSALPQTSTSKILVCRNTCVAFPWNWIFSSHKSAFF